MARLLRSFAEASALEEIAIMAAMVLPALVLQKPSANSKANAHQELLIRRMQQWKNGDISGLLEEGRVIQQHLHYAQSGKPGPDLKMDEDYVAGSFGKQVHAGNMRAALRLLSQSTTGQHSRVMNANDPIDDTHSELGTVLDALKSKHPQGGEANQDALLQENMVDAPILSPSCF